MKNSVAIVTGASQGIGRCTAIRLAHDFSAVVLAARNAKALEEVAAEVQQAGSGISSVHTPHSATVLPATPADSNVPISCIVRQAASMR